MNEKPEICPHCRRYTERGKQQLDLEQRAHPLYGTDFSIPLSDTVEEYRPMNVRQLYDHLSRFEGDNDHSNDVDCRWLASVVKAWMPLVAEVMNSRLGPEAHNQVNAFRAAEVEKELERKRREVDVLERDLKTLKQVVIPA